MPVTKTEKRCMIESLNKNELMAYAQQCNCFCRMGRGIAPLIAKARPDARDADNNTVRGDLSKMGTFTRTHPEAGSLVYNIYGQYHWRLHQVEPGRNTDYVELYKGLCAMAEDLRSVFPDHETITVGFPFIGCGLAGGDWDKVVLPAIKQVFEDEVFEVTIFDINSEAIMKQHLTMSHLNLFVTVIGQFSDPEDIFELGQSLPIFFSLDDEENIATKLLLGFVKKTHIVEGIISELENVDEDGTVTYGDGYGSPSYEFKEKHLLDSLDLLMEAYAYVHKDKPLVSTHLKTNALKKYTKQLAVTSHVAASLLDDPECRDIRLTDFPFTVGEYADMLLEPVAAIHDGEGHLVAVPEMVYGKVLSDYAVSHAEELLSIKYPVMTAGVNTAKLWPLTSIIKTGLAGHEPTASFEKEATFKVEAGKTYKLDAKTHLGGLNVCLNPTTYDEAKETDADVIVLDYPKGLSLFTDKWATVIAVLTGKAVLFKSTSMLSECDFVLESGSALPTHGDGHVSMFSHCRVSSLAGWCINTKRKEEA